MKLGALVSVMLMLLLATQDVLGQQWEGANNTTGAIDRLGKVGVGTSNPAAEMHINTVILPVVLGTPPPDSWQLAVSRYFQLTGTTHIDFSIRNGKTGIGTEAPGFPLSFADELGDKISLWGQSGDHYGFGIQGNLLQLYTDVVASDIAFGFGNSQHFTETMRVKGSGSVGVGTASPDAKLHVVQDEVFKTGILGNGEIGIHGVGHTQGVFGEVASAQLDIAFNSGVRGVAGAGAGVSGSNTGVLLFEGAVHGINTSICCGSGVVGETTGNGTGVFGEGGATGTGVAGDGFVGVKGISNQNGIAVWGFNHDTRGFAVFSDGDFAVAPGFAKSAIVQTRDYGQRKLYVVESPENWFEDFGGGKLIDGRALVKIDPVFAQTVNLTADYHVFLTPRDGFAQLYVTNYTTNGFEVRDAGGHANVAFSYRIIAKRVGFEGRRLETAAGPPAIEHPELLRRPQK